MHILWAEQKSTALTPFELELHNYLIRRLNVARQKILWHVPLSQVIRKPTNPDALKAWYYTAVPLIVLEFASNRERFARCAGVYKDCDEDALGLLRRAGIIVYTLNENRPASNQILLKDVNDDASRAEKQHLINLSEFMTRSNFEELLKKHLDNPFFDNRLSRMETSMLTTSEGKQYSQIANLRNGLLENGHNDLAALRRVEDSLSDLGSRLAKSRDTLADYIFLHEVSLANIIDIGRVPPSKNGTRLISRSFDSTTCSYNTLSGKQKARLERLVQGEIEKEFGVQFSEWASGQDERIALANYRERQKKYFSSSLKATRFFDFLDKTAVDILVLNRNAKALLAIEFDGPHHDEPDQQRRDQWKTSALNQIELPLIRISYKDNLFEPAKQLGFGQLNRRREILDFLAYYFHFLVSVQEREAGRLDYSQYVSEHIDELRRNALERDLDTTVLNRSSGEEWLSEFDSAPWRALDQGEQEIFVGTAEEVFYELETKAGDANQILQETRDIALRKKKWLIDLEGQKSVQFSELWVEKGHVFGRSARLTPKHGDPSPLYRASVDLNSFTYSSLPLPRSIFVRSFLDALLIDRLYIWYLYGPRGAR